MGIPLPKLVGREIRARQLNCNKVYKNKGMNGTLAHEKNMGNG